MSRARAAHRLPVMAARTKTAGATTPKKSTSRKTTRLSLDDWIGAAFDLLVREGASGVKITKLCEQLGVTKGSFYWHFDDIDALMTTIADRWCDKQNDTVRGLNAMDTIPVAERFERMAQTLIDEDTRRVEIAVRDWARTDQKVADSVAALDRRIFEVVQDAMREGGFDEDTRRVEIAVRDWARTDQKVADSVAALDRRIFEVVQDAMREVGFDEEQARLRAGALVYAGIGFVHSRGSLPTPTLDEVRATFDLLTAGASSGS